MLKIDWTFLKKLNYLVKIHDIKIFRDIRPPAMFMSPLGQVMDDQRENVK